jgi:hypothetical protein
MIDRISVSFKTKAHLPHTGLGAIRSEVSLGINQETVMPIPEASFPHWTGDTQIPAAVESSS